MIATSQLSPAARFRAAHLDAVISEWLDDGQWETDESLDETLRFGLIDARLDGADEDRPLIA